MYRERAPSRALAPYVGCFWELASGGGRQRILPDGAMDVLYAIGDASARVIGPMTRAHLTEGDAPVRLAGVRFRPGAAIDLLGVPAHELRDADVSVSDVWGRRGRSLDARLAAASTSSEAVRALEAELVSRLGSAGAPDRRVGHAVHVLRVAGGELPIPAVGASVGVSERQLERLFEERVGYGPKLFARIVRLQRSTASIAARSGSMASWASLAAECGYADQAHLIREFRALTGVTPRLYARERAMSEIDNPANDPRR
jgi:AraC-like DNA-binding protein